MNTNETKTGFFSNLKYDAPASIIVFLVALPLCLGIALASGAPLFAGIIAGVIGGLVVSLLSGSPLGVSGPAAGLAVIVLTSIQELGAFDAFLYAVVVAGIIQLILGYFNAGVIGYFFPSAVIKGMLAGIGIIIVLKQIPHAFGYDKDPEGDLSFFQRDGHTTLSELSYMLDSINFGAVTITLVSLAILILWERPFMKKYALFQWVQGPLVAVSSGIGLEFLFRGIPDFSLSAEQVVSLPVAESVSGFIGQFSLPDFSQWSNPDVYLIALTIAVVASLETLLCVEATDKLDPQKRVTPTNRELKAQGVGNILSGLIGGLPITQVIVRSSANIQSGGRTKAAAFFHGALLLLSVISIPHVLNLIPLASLAAILLMVGYKLAKPSLFRQMYKMSRSQFIPFLVTVTGIVFTDLLIGIGLGMVIAIFHILWNNFKTPYHFDPAKYVKGEPIYVQLSENVSFLNKASIHQALIQLPRQSEVIIDASKAKSIHPDVQEIFEDFIQQAPSREIKVEWKEIETSPDHDPVEQFGYVVAELSDYRK
ncbi:MAG: SulP family inorganic anion transporter [Cyclobacteriaceae bacterium]|nr:SulP family inorganic anion transporter [Cyclobacteriaceae bacterium]